MQRDKDIVRARLWDDDMMSQHSQTHKLTVSIHDHRIDDERRDTDARYASFRSVCASPVTIVC